MCDTDKEHTCLGRLCKKDSSIFRKYIETTTTHGVVWIFSGKSVVRRLFWLLLVLAATACCLHNCIDRILFLASNPTSTSISIKRSQPISFPAVSLCNLNFLTRDGLEAHGILDLASSVLNSGLEELENGECNRTVHSHPLSGSIQLEELVFTAGHVTDDIISNCDFQGRPCSREDFDLTLTPFGLCYTFNSGRGKPVLNVTGTGARQALTTFIDIQQDQYVASPAYDAGLIVVVHPQSEPPLPLDLGIAVAPGTHAFIGLTRRDVFDQTRSQCHANSDITGFNYLQGEYNYSVSACTLDCFLSQVVKKCGCSYFPSQYPPDTPAVSDLRSCTFLDLCCVKLQAYFPEQCDCSSACESEKFSTFTSYSALPAVYARDTIEEELNISFAQVQSDVVLVSVYFESINVETFTTSDAYTAVAVLSDIGGQLGLFLGVSVISMVEFGFWLLDEFRDRCLCCVHRKHQSKKGSEEVEMDNGGSPA